MKDSEVIQEQRPDVISLAPPAEAEEEFIRTTADEKEAQTSIWEFVVWVWAFQTSHGGLEASGNGTLSGGSLVRFGTPRSSIKEAS